MSAGFKYEVRGVCIYGDGKQLIVLPREAHAGDIFYANSHFYQVVIAGLLEVQYEGGQSTHMMVAKELGFWSDFTKLPVPA